MKHSEYPKIHLAVDNCFAIKRWVEPRDWMKIIKQIGNIKYIEASTDNEIDPSHNTKLFRDQWVNDVQYYEKMYDLKVCSFYSGYATYRTTGICSMSESKRMAMIDRYFKPTIDMAAALGAQVGNTLSAFSEPVLQNPELYRTIDAFLDQSLAEMTRYAGERKVLFGYEQMYTPTQGMWTIQECLRRMRTAYTRTGFPMYITIDTAHMVGQHMYQKPTRDDLVKMIQTCDFGKFRLPPTIMGKIRTGENVDRIYSELSDYDYWFAEPNDVDVFSWLSELGCYSPLVHLQQTDGSYSSHKPFTEKYNQTGIINPPDVLRSIAKSYETECVPGMPAKVSDIYLAFELFFGVTDPASQIIQEMQESVSYWRNFIPEDGIPLNELIDRFQ